MGFYSRYIEPSPHIEPIQDPSIKKKQYHYWRIRILYSMFIGYAIYYFTRGTLAIAMPQLKQLGYNEIHLGWLITFFQISYGISKFANGLFADRANPRYLMAIGLMMTGVTTICFGVTSSIVAFLLLWSLNGWFQGCGSAPCHRLLTHWYSVKERGRWWGAWNTSHNVGAAILPLFAAYLLTSYGWEYVMIVPGLVAILFGFFLINRLRDTPQSLGLPAIEEFHDEQPSLKKKEPEKELPYREILFEHVIKNKWMWILSCAYFMVYLIRWTLSHWAFYFLVDSQGYEAWTAAKCIWWYEVGGFAGGLAAGWLSDLAFKGHRTGVNILFFTGLIPSLYAFSFFTSSGASPLLIQGIMAGIGFCVFGPQMLLAVHAAEISHKKASATAVGFLGIIAYLGSAVTGGPLGHFVKETSWTHVFSLLEVCAFVGAISLLPLLLRKKTTEPSALLSTAH